MTDTERVAYPKRIESRTAAALGPIVEAIQNTAEIAGQEAAIRETLWKKAEPMIMAGSMTPTGMGIILLESPPKSLPKEYGKTVEVWLRGTANLPSNSGNLTPTGISIMGKIPSRDGSVFTLRPLFNLERHAISDTCEYTVRIMKGTDASLEQMHAASTILDGLALAYQMPTPPQSIPQV